MVPCESLINRCLVLKCALLKCRFSSEDRGLDVVRDRLRMLPGAAEVILAQLQRS
jgi:hypothetical protein